MIKGKTLEISIEKLKYLLSLETSGFEYNSIEIEPIISNNNGKIYEYEVTFDIKIPLETLVKEVARKLESLDNYFQELLHNYSLSQNGNLVYSPEGYFFVSEGIFVEGKGIGWEELNVKLEYTVFLEE